MILLMYRACQFVPPDIMNRPARTAKAFRIMAERFNGRHKG